MYVRSEVHRPVRRLVRRSFSEAGSRFRPSLTAREDGEVAWHPHQPCPAKHRRRRVRHNAATELRREFGLEAAQVLLGHSKADVTQVYAERDVNRAVTVAARIG